MERLRTASRRLRRRFVMVNTLSLSASFLLDVVLDEKLATGVAGGITLGMVLLVCPVFVLLASVVRYDLACASQCDPCVDELRDAASDFGARGVWR
ncbi:hypothetical protein ACFWJU_35565 [Streptomyces mutabilis]|uniref:hypothetical protein n=1 Tax=Streptomyces mutabilis TaxID=67332 RepID=UPI0036594848